MDINKLIKKAHENAGKNGLYECSWCDGRGFWDKPLSDSQIEFDAKCDECSCTGIDKNKNIHELLMGVITEISKAVEAFGNRKFSDWKSYNLWIKEPESYPKEATFEMYIKGTHEDKIADVFVRLFELCGYLGIEYKKPYDININNTFGIDDNISASLFDCIKIIVKVDLNEEDRNYYIHYVIAYMIRFCKHFDVDIEKHVKIKMKYNKIKQGGNND